MTTKQLIQQGEMAREQGELSQALISFDQALFSAMAEKNYSLALETLSQRLILFKHSYQRSNDSAYMELLYSEALSGLRLAEFCKINGQPKAAFYSRSGDYFLAKLDFPESIKHYQLALEELEKDPNVATGTKAEYLGHKAQAVAKSGDPQGFAQLDEALNLIRSDQELRPFHKIVIESGILMRKVDAYIFLKQLDKTEQPLAEATKLADILAREHNMKMRQFQAATLAEHIAKIKNS